MFSSEELVFYILEIHMTANTKIADYLITLEMFIKVYYQVKKGFKIALSFFVKNMDMQKCLEK